MVSMQDERGGTTSVSKGEAVTVTSPRFNPTTPVCHQWSLFHTERLIPLTSAIIHYCNTHHCNISTGDSQLSRHGSSVLRRSEEHRQWGASVGPRGGRTAQKGLGDASH